MVIEEKESKYMRRKQITHHYNHLYSITTHLVDMVGKAFHRSHGGPSHLAIGKGLIHGKCVGPEAVDPHRILGVVERWPHRVEHWGRAAKRRRKVL